MLSLTPYRVLLALALSAAATVGACSSTTTPSSAAATDGGAPDTAATSDGAPPADGGSPGAVSAACALFVPYVARCKSSDACATAQAMSCTTFLARYSDAFLGAIAACGGGDCTAVGTCITEHEAMQAPTPTQERIKAEYCTVCAADCDTFLDISGGVPGMKDGAGAVVRHASDEAATRIETKCVKSLTAAGCGSSFFMCSFGEGESPVLPECK